MEVDKAEEDMAVQRMVNYVFEHDAQGPSRWNIRQQGVSEWVQSQVNQVELEYLEGKIAADGNKQPTGRLGPSKVSFREKCVGKYEVHQNPLGIIAKDNFVSVLATTAVYEGKWQYEVNIGSSGVMQVGWSTMEGNFTADKGVGDTPFSYSYDGNRQRSWNVHSCKYGDMWQSGDVITCAIDMDARTISYLRNGRSLGVAFSNLASRRLHAYFPAMSLSKGEYLKVNFGDLPMIYPMEGYKPLQDAPEVKVVIANRCLRWLCRLSDVAIEHQKRESDQQDQKPDSSSSMFRRLACERATLASHVIKVLGPLLTDDMSGAYIVNDCLVPTIKSLLPHKFMVDVVNSSTFVATGQEPLQQFFNQVEDGRRGPMKSRLPSEDHPVMAPLMLLLDYLHAFLQTKPLLRCLKSVILHCVTQCRQPADSLEFNSHKGALLLLGGLLTHPRTRYLIIDQLLFDGTRLQSLFCFTASDGLLQEVVGKEVYWSRDDTSPPVHRSSGDKDQFQAKLLVLDEALADVERLHVAVLSLLLTMEPLMPIALASRTRFLHKLRHTLIKNSLPLAKFKQPMVVPLFHSLLQTLGRLLIQEVPCGLRQCLPVRLFYEEGGLDFLDCNRLGGLQSHLMKAFAEERRQALLEETYTLQPGQCPWRGAGDADGSGSWFTCPNHGPAAGDGGSHCDMETDDTPGAASMFADADNGRSRLVSIYELCDCLLLMYHYCSHRTLVRVGIDKETLHHMLERVADVTARINSLLALPEDQRNAVVLAELQSTLSMLHAECDRHVVAQSWPRVLHFAPRRMQGYVNLLQLAFNTLKSASDSGKMFAFLPEYYLEVVTDLALGLADNFFLDDYKVTEHHSELYLRLGHFLSHHFTDARVRFTDSREVFMQTLASFVTCQPTLRVLESIDQDGRQSLVRSLLQPYENRVWAQNNWILVRFWKGSGFSFRYYLSPHLKTKITPKPTHSDTGMQTIKPTPSLVFQQEVKRVLAADHGFSMRFVNSLLNQLNWAFSEFIGMLQEIQNFCSRLERVFIDSRQLRICSTCFNLTVSLLRVLEMAVTLAPQLFLQQTTGSSSSTSTSSAGQPDVLLSMLCKLLCHVLNRVSVGGRGCFSHIVSLEIPGLDCLHHFPVLAAAAGIVTALLKEDVNNKDNPSHDPVATKALVSEPSFELSSFEALLGINSTNDGGGGGAAGGGGDQATAAATAGVAAVSLDALITLDGPTVAAGDATALVAATASDSEGTQPARMGLSNASVSGEGVSSAGGSTPTTVGQSAPSMMSEAYSGDAAARVNVPVLTNDELQRRLALASRPLFARDPTDTTTGNSSSWYMPGMTVNPAGAAPTQAPTAAAATAATASTSDTIRGQFTPFSQDGNTLFSFLQYPEDVQEYEVSLLRSCLSYLREYEARPAAPSSGDDYQDCIICYARPATATFSPCGHTSCRACVTQHLMSQKDCFFCMVAIQLVRDNVTRKVIIDTANSLSAAAVEVSAAPDQRETSASVTTTSATINTTTGSVAPFSRYSTLLQSRSSGSSGGSNATTTSTDTSSGVSGSLPISGNNMDLANGLLNHGNLLPSRETNSEVFLNFEGSSDSAPSTAPLPAAAAVAGGGGAPVQILHSVVDERAPLVHFFPNISDQPHDDQADRDMPTAGEPATLPR